MGHGLEPTPDGEAGRLQRIEGGQSYWFGLEQNSTQPGVNLYQSNSGLYNTYNLPGGAHGTLTTDTFSLAGYAPGDAPTFYFTYRADHDTALDSFRVYISNDGVELVVARSDASAAEIPKRQPFCGQSGQRLRNGGRRGSILARHAGLENLRIRFDFNTLGGRDVNVSNFTGSPLSAIPGADLEDGDFFTLRDPRHVRDHELRVRHGFWHSRPSWRAGEFPRR